METKAKIKVIKKELQPEFKNNRPAKIVKTKTAQQSAREAVSIVGDWVAEFRQKRRSETNEAFKLLFEVRQAENCANC